jgi:anti-anti-sigma factor
VTGGPGGAAGCRLVATGPLLRRLAVAGEIDIMTAPGVQRFLETQLSSTVPGTTVVVDLSGVDVLSAAGVGVLVRVRDEAARRGVRLVADPVSAQARRVLDLTGVHLEPGRHRP